MNLSEYQNHAARTISNKITVQESCIHSLLGMAAEVGELTGIFQKNLQGHELNHEHIIKECGDILWMLAEFCTVSGISLETVAQTNIEKLRARYPNGFDAERSRNREANDI